MIFRLHLVGCFPRSDLELTFRPDLLATAFLQNFLGVCLLAAPQGSSWRVSGVGNLY